MHRESQRCPKPFQVGDPSDASFSERKMFSNKQLGHPQTTVQDDVRKLVGRHGRQCRRKFEKHDFIDTGSHEAFELFLGVREKLQFHMRRQNPDRVRIERDHHGRAPDFASPCHHCL